ncbi:hypothetical protein EVAR_49673_1 [Eumeta japonica]|uniref:Uncharacterized protein n=1 Tax=Eumeta variegata TaxID=151549 RepID=A0A4C1WPR0_EUMVA|nr:hypothetical protein EVAR_49673_1 [Eumeta japonica]
MVIPRVKISTNCGFHNRLQGEVSGHDELSNGSGIHAKGTFTRRPIRNRCGVLFTCSCPILAARNECSELRSRPSKPHLNAATEDGGPLPFIFDTRSKEIQQVSVVAAMFTQIGLPYAGPVCFERLSALLTVRAKTQGARLSPLSCRRNKTCSNRNLYSARNQCGGDAISAMCGVSLKDRCGNSNVRERCRLKEDVVTRIEKVQLYNLLFVVIEIKFVVNLKLLRGILIVGTDFVDPKYDRAKPIWLQHENVHKMSYLTNLTGLFDP